jgi:hypothetical protein
MQKAVDRLVGLAELVLDDDHPTSATLARKMSTTASFLTRSPFFQTRGT